MNRRASLALAIGACAATFLGHAQAAGTPREMHGNADAFAAPGMALAWGILRGATEDMTMVVIRIETDPALFSALAIRGADPFSQQQTAVLPITPAAGGVELRLPRPHFAAFPRTEFLLFAPGWAATVENAALLVFYLGVPDTTPEFVDEGKLEAYLRARLAPLRGDKRP